MADRPPLISVVVPARNAADTIVGCVEALCRQTTKRPYEIIVVDNSSTDDTAVLAATAGARVVTATTPGAAAARNAGIAAARGAIVCFTDGDCEPTAEWVDAITQPLDDPAIVGAKGVYGTRQRAIVARFVQIEYEDKYDLLRDQPRIDFIDTYSAAYRRDILLANGGFDERIFYVEDQELSFRLAARGYEMVFQPQARVYHQHAATAIGYAVKKFHIAYWKAQIIRRFPTQGVRDSHTPQVMKLQMVLLSLLGPTILGGFLWGGAWVIAALLLLAFLATTLPFIHKAWGKDRGVALASPFLLALRALALSAGYAWGLARPIPDVSGTESTIGGVNYVSKRALDIAGAGAGLLLCLVVTPFIALAIKLDSRGPVFFRQERIGQGGRPFTMYKFRSMHAGAEEVLDTIVDLASLPDPAFKLKDDPRCTAVGRFLRRWSLDELPQFWNILRGEMSLIGPRPEEARVVALYNDWHRRRLSVKPGLSGPMQVNGRADLTLDERVRLELEYIEHYSLWRDFAILARTLPAVIAGSGAR